MYSFKLILWLRREKKRQLKLDYGLFFLNDHSEGS